MFQWIASQLVAIPDDPLWLQEKESILFFLKEKHFTDILYNSSMQSLFVTWLNNIAEFFGKRCHAKCLEVKYALGAECQPVGGFIWRSFNYHRLKEAHFYRNEGLQKTIDYFAAILKEAGEIIPTGPGAAKPEA